MNAIAEGIRNIRNGIPIFLRFFLFFSVCVLCGLEAPLEAWNPLPGINISAPQMGVTPFVQVGIDAAGNATAIWNNENNEILFATLPRGSSVWSSPSMISSNGVLPQIAVSPSGYSVAVWQDASGPSGTVKSAIRPVFGAPWSSPITVSAPTTQFFVLNPQVAVDSNGNAVAVWSWFNGSTHVIQAATLLANAPAWTNLTNLSDPIKDSVVPAIALDASGNGVAVWDQITDGLMQARTFLGGTWLPTIFTLGTSFTTENLALAINPSGVAVAVWQDDSSVIHASRFIGGVWSSSDPNLSGFQPAVAVDIFGNALALSVGPGLEISSAYLPIGSNVWLPPIVVTMNATVTYAGPKVAFDAQGNATAVWSLQTLSELIQAAQLPFGTNLWVNQTDLSAAENDSFLPQIAVDPSGYAVAVWNAGLPNATVVAQATTNAAPPLPPSNFVGTLKKNKFLNRTECLLSAMFEASISNVGSYQIYQNGVLVATILATGPFIFNTCLCDCSAGGFEVAAVGLDGLVSNRIALKAAREKSCR